MTDASGGSTKDTEWKSSRVQIPQVKGDTALRALCGSCESLNPCGFDFVQCINRLTGLAVAVLSQCRGPVAVRNKG